MGEVANPSPFELSPVLWIAIVSALVIVPWRFAPTRWGRAAAVALAVFSSPRLLASQLSTLLAPFGGRAADRAPRVSGGHGSTVPVTERTTGT